MYNVLNIWWRVPLKLVQRCYLNSFQFDTDHNTVTCLFYKNWSICMWKLFTRYVQQAISQWTYHLCVSGTFGCRSYPPSVQSPVVAPSMYQSQTVETSHDLPGQKISRPSKTTESVKKIQDSYWRWVFEPWPIIHSPKIFRPWHLQCQQLFFFSADWYLTSYENLHYN